MRQGRVKRLWCLALCLLSLTACGPRNEGHTERLYAMDTTMDLTAYGPQAEVAVTAGAKEINALDDLLSAQRPGSDIAKLNRAQGEAVTVSDETAQLLEKALALCADTGGVLDVTIYPVMRAWGFDSKDYRVPGESELAALLERVDYATITVKGHTVTVPEGVELDLGAVGKGYAGDRIVALWRDMGLESGLLYLGGNVQCLGGKPDGSDWSVGIRDPEDESALLATVTGRDMAVVTSGGYQRYFDEGGVRYHHIMDPATGKPAHSGAASVTIVADSGTLCDALSTALYVMGPDQAADYWRAHRDFEMIYYTEGGTLLYTAGLKDRLTLRDDLAGEMVT